MSGRTEAGVADGVSFEELNEILAVTREFAERELAPRALAVDDDEGQARLECWNGLCEIGLDRAILPEADGGIGIGLAGLLAVIEELAVGEGGIATMALLSNAALAVLPADARASIDGVTRVALVPLPEPGTPGGGSLKIVDGAKADGRIEFALGAFGAGALVLVARESDSRVLYLVRGDADGLTLAGDEDQMGLNGAPAAVIECTGTPVVRVGGEAEAVKALALVNAGIAAIARGVSRRARDIALDYAENRYQGGSMIIEYGAIVDMLARISERNRAIAGASAFHGYSLDSVDRDGGRELLAQALAAKAAATEAAAESTTDAVQSMGGMGYMHETGVEKLMRDARYCQLFPQSNWLVRDDLIQLERG